MMRTSSERCPLQYWSIFLLLVLIPNLVFGEIPGQKKIYTVGVVPQFDSLKLRQIWHPILEELTRRTGVHLVLKGSPTIPAFEKEFNQGAFDFAYMNPYHVLKANQMQGYIPLIRDNGSMLFGILVVRKDSPVESPEQLAGKRVAFPAPNALGASLMIRAAFQDDFNIKIQPRYVQTHSSVYLNVALEEADAGGGVQKTLNSQSPDVKNSLKIIYQTRKVNPHPFTAHPRVPAEIRKKITEAFLEMGKTDSGKNLISQIPIKKAGPAKIEDYFPLKDLKLERFYQEDKPWD